MSPKRAPVLVLLLAACQRTPPAESTEPAAVPTPPATAHVEPAATPPAPEAAASDARAPSATPPASTPTVAPPSPAIRTAAPRAAEIGFTCDTRTVDGLCVEHLKSEAGLTPRTITGLSAWCRARGGTVSDRPCASQPVLTCHLPRSDIFYEFFAAGPRPWTLDQATRRCAGLRATVDAPVRTATP